jgi:hypothetical protein
VQTSDPLQAVPQAPQLRASVLGSTHALLQSSWLLVQEVVVHAPATQLWPRLQAVPQAPQLVASVWRSTHAPLHRVTPELQVQAPLVQFAPVPHITPQVPQS